jgi:hypothetical protein
VLPQPTSWRSILILSHFCLVLFSTGFSTKPLYTPLPHTFYMSNLSHSLFFHPNIIGWTVQIVKLLIMQCSALHCCLVPLSLYIHMRPIYIYIYICVRVHIYLLPPYRNPPINYKCDLSGMQGHCQLLCCLRLSNRSTNNMSGWAYDWAYIAQVKEYAVNKM